MKKEVFEPGKKCRVTRHYESSCPDPIRLNLSEKVSIEDRESEWSGWLWCINKNGKSGWVPERYVERTGEIGKMLFDYDANELTIVPGEELEILKEESG